MITEISARKKEGNLVSERSISSGVFRALERVKILIIKHLHPPPRHHHYLIIKKLAFFHKVIHSLSETYIKKVVNRLVFLQTMFIVSSCVVNIPR